MMFLLYNHCQAREIVRVERWGDSGRKINLDCPKAVNDYFHSARGVDVLNQLHYSYLLGRKSERSCTRLKWWIIDMAIINAFELWLLHHPTGTQLEFRTQLKNELAAPHRDAQMRVRTAAANKANRCLPGALASQHFSAHSESRRICAICSDDDGNSVRTHSYCSVCNVALCLGECFSTYHSPV